MEEATGSDTLLSAEDNTAGLNEASKQAKKAVEEAKKLLNGKSAVNLKKEIKEIVIEKIMYLQELVQRLTISRTNLLEEYNETKKKYAKRINSSPTTSDEEDDIGYNQDFPPLQHKFKPELYNNNNNLCNIANVNIVSLQETISILHQKKILNKTNKSIAIKNIKGAIQGFESFINNPPIITDIIKQSISEITKQIITLPNSKYSIPTQPNSSYSQIIKTPTIIPVSKPALIISPKNEVNSSKETMNLWKNSVTFKDTNFAPSKIKLISNNKIRIEFDNSSQRDTALEKTKSPNSTIYAEIPKTLQPSIIIKGIPNDVEPSQIIDIITNQNDSIKQNKKTSNDIIYSFKRNNKNKNLYNAIFRTTPNIFRAIIQSGKINLDHYRIHVEEYIPLLQCYKCLKYGHTRSHCTQTQSICSYCSSNEHEYKNCLHKNDQIKLNCYNCSKFNQLHTNTIKRPTQHSATSNTCPCYTQMYKITQSRINYE